MSANTRSRSKDRLSARKVETATEPGYYFDGGGLLLHISKNGGKRWLLRFVSPLTGKRREMGLGPAGKGAVSLADARSKADDARRLARDGTDPIERRNAEAERLRAEGLQKKPQTFGEFSDDWMRDNLKQFSNPKHRAQWRMTLTKYAAPLRPMALEDIQTPDVVAVLRPIWEGKHETAKRTQGRIERVFDAAIAQGARSGSNPARWRGHLSMLLPKVQPTDRNGNLGVGHHAAMNWKDLPDFIPALRQRAGVAARALEFAILTAARSGEVRGATWAEIDLEVRRWIVPGWRMKARQEHRVPLSARAVEILLEMETYRPENDENGATLVFPGAKPGTSMSDMTLSAVLKRMEIKGATPHGFRSAFRDWAEDTEAAPYGAIKSALAHTLGDKVDAAYRRGDGFERRAVLMEHWAKFLEGER
ncbi:tyrosine-type recombinase/integrase [Shimia sp. R9_2]|uniref:tyrosine-type recombinase/integrase n=1 Tax=Shimia sp. R9_2 TaxID=2821112 RepID=UPI001ADAC732|nr:site-specific integrase [Shimia sp. R9_2]MBO9398229.1 tyrosine-type recombinase/integrase [Shimia sp. R9_2]